MKKLFLLVLIGFIANISAFSQDTIFLKNNSSIKAQVIEIGTSVIKYKKYDNRETSPVYNIYKSEVRVIKYEDGTLDSFSNVTDKSKSKENNNQITSDGINDTIKNNYISKFYFGGGYSLMNRYKIGNALEFWQRVNGDNSEVIDQASGFFILKLGYLDNIDKNKTHWLGMDGQIVITPSHALWGTTLGFGFRNEIHFKAMFMNIALQYGYAMDKNKNALFIIEPGLDLGTMTGTISINNTYYEQSSAFGVGGHFAIGVDYFINKNFTANFRLGYRGVSINETHRDENSETGYSSFYVNGKNGENVKVNWSGIYSTMGVCLSLNKKRK
ncbi:hypothetical protein ACFLQ5_02030 [Bacteroidota bacterium]